MVRRLEDDDEERAKFYERCQELERAKRMRAKFVEVNFDVDFTILNKLRVEAVTPDVQQELSAAWRADRNALQAQAVARRTEKDRLIRERYELFKDPVKAAADRQAMQAKNDARAGAWLSYLQACTAIVHAKQFLFHGIAERQELAKLEASAEVMSRCVRRYTVKPIRQ